MDDESFKKALKDAVDDGNVDELDFLLASYRWGNKQFFVLEILKLEDVFN